MKILLYLQATLWLCFSSIEFSNGATFEGDNIIKMIKASGYPFKNYTVQTSDGYLLNMYRIPRSPNRLDKSVKQVVFIMHGLLSSAADFLIMGPNKSLAYLLSDAGYDVWMGNARGNTWSRNHISKDPDHKEFWDFTWHEIGTIDMPNMIDFVLKRTGQEKLLLIGHSQGVTTSAVMLSELPSYNAKIETLFMLSPVIALHDPSPLVQFLTDNMYQIDHALGMFEFFEILPSKPIMQTLATMACDVELETHLLCRDAMFAWAGTSPDEYNATLLPFISENSPAGCSWRQMLHFFQIVQSGKFQKFDHRADNMKVYGQETPPEYDISKISTNVHVFYGGKDLLYRTKDAVRTIELLGKNVISHENLEGYNHIDFLYGKTVKAMLYDKIIEKMQL